ncbi:MAG: TetR/AcrR family transcriptional regulator [Chloroflexota bacterium]
MMNTEDLRVKRTDQRLREAFIQLITDQGYDKVTVRDIINQAGVGNKTFYRHYEGKEALLNAILQDLIHDLRKTLDYSFKDNPPLQNLTNSLKFTQANSTLFIALAQSPAADELLKPMLQAAIEEGHLFVREMDVPKDLVAYHFASSIDALIKWWLKNDMPYSIEEMVDYINKLILNPISTLND